MSLKTELLGIAEALDRASIPYALCGGMAVVLHGYPRLTRDVDLLVEPARLDRVKEVLAEIGFTIPGGIIPFDLGTKQERRVYRLSKRVDADLLTVDLIILPSFLQDVWDTREVYDVGGVPIQTVSREGLLRMKRISGRAQDLSDIENLELGSDEPS